MNDHERDVLERLIAGMAEVKTELVGLSMHVELQNGSVARHMAEDLAFQREQLDWQKAHEIRAARGDGVTEGRKQALGLIDRLIVLAPSALAVAAAAYAVLR